MVPDDLGGDPRGRGWTDALAFAGGQRLENVFLQLAEVKAT
jgi:hypothetical protein